MKVLESDDISGSKSEFWGSDDVFEKLGLRKIPCILPTIL